MLYYRCFSRLVCAFYMKFWVYSLIIICTYRYTFGHFLVFYGSGFYWMFIILRHSLIKIIHVIRYVQLSDISFKIFGNRNNKSKDIIYLNINYVSSSKIEAFLYVCMSQTSIPSCLGSYSILFLVLSMW